MLQSVPCRYPFVFLFFFFNATAPTEIYTLSLHDALPILLEADAAGRPYDPYRMARMVADGRGCLHTGHRGDHGRSEEHTSELQSHSDLVCRLLLEKKKRSR